MSLREMARKMGISNPSLYVLETGRHSGPGWPIQRKRDYLRILEEWKKNPTPRPRKKRTTKPKKQLVPVPHQHGEVVGIG